MRLSRKIIRTLITQRNLIDTLTKDIQKTTKKRSFKKYKIQDKNNQKCHQNLKSKKSKKTLSSNPNNSIPNSQTY